MTRLLQNRWVRRAAFGAVGALGLGAAMLPSAPAQAQVYVGFGFPGYVASPYYGYSGYYGRPYYNYGYGYRYPGAYIGFGGGWHHRHHHWR